MDFLNHIMSGYTPILIFIFLCFAALMIFFIKLSRNLEALIRIARYDRTALMDQLAVMQNSLEDLVRYQSDTYNFFQSLYQDDTSTPIDESDQPYAEADAAYPEPEFDKTSEDTDAEPLADARGAGIPGAGAAIAGAAAGLAAGALITDQEQTPAAPSFDDIPDLADLVDEEDALFETSDAVDSAAGFQPEDISGQDFNLTLDETIPPVTPESAAAVSDEEYDALAGETMEFNENDYAHYSSTLADKQAKEDFSITPETDDELAMPVQEELSDDDNDLIIDGMNLDFTPEDATGAESGLGDISLDLDSPTLSETDFQEQDLVLDVPQDLSDDDLIFAPEDTEVITDSPNVSDLDLSFDSADAVEEPEVDELEFSLHEDSSDLPEAQSTGQEDLPELNFHEEPESEISMALDEEDDSIYLLDEPLTTDDESAPSDALQEFELSDVAESSAPVSADEELDMDLLSDTVREPATYETVADDALAGDIVMDFPVDEDVVDDAEFDVEPQHIDLDFQLEDESESDQGVVLAPHEQEFVLDDDEEDDVIISEDDDEDDSDLDLLVDNLLDVPEEVNLDADAEDGPDFETAIVIDDDDEELPLENPVVSESVDAFPDVADEDLLPEADLSEEALVIDSDADSFAGEEELTFNFDQPQFSAAQEDQQQALHPDAVPEEEISTQDMMLTLDETIELDKAAASEKEHQAADDTFAAANTLIDDQDTTTSGFLLEGLMDLPGSGSEHGFSFGGNEQEDPFSLQDLDITIMDQDDASISLEKGEADAKEDDIALPDVSFKTLPDADTDAAPHADDLLELETDELVEDSVQDISLTMDSDDAPAADTNESDDEGTKKSANILDFIIDQ